MARVAAEATEAARQIATDESAAARQYVNGAAAELERLKLVEQAGEREAETLRGEAARARDEALEQHRMRREFESAAQVELQSKLAVEAKLRQTEDALQKKMQEELQEERRRSEAEMVQ